MSDTPKYPHITVDLTNCDGNAYSILGKVRSRLKKAGIPENEIKAFSDEATSGNYDHLLQTVMKTVNTT
jgi:hypothetical protein